MGLPLELPVTLTSVDCGNCGGTYAINQRFRQQKIDKGGYWHCPYCQCSWGYKTGEEKTAEERRVAELAAEKERHRITLTRLNVAEAAKDKALREANRLKTRASAGVCPCCNRTFKQLAAHMKSKHPDAKKGEGASS